MDHKALTILKHLSDGNDPETGKPFPPDSPYQRPDVIRALFHAVRELENPPAGVARRCDPGAGSLPEDTAGALLASAVASPRRGAPAPRSGKPAEGGAVPAGVARRCDPGAGSLPEDTAGTPLASTVASPRRGAPAPRSGKPWSTEEDEKLVAGFDAGGPSQRSPPTMAAAVSPSRRASPGSTRCRCPQASAAGKPRTHPISTVPSTPPRPEP